MRWLVQFRIFCMSTLFCRPTQAFQKPVLVWLITRNWAKWWTLLFSTQRWWIPWWICWWRHQTFLFSGKRHKIMQYRCPVHSKENSAVKLFRILVLFCSSSSFYSRAFEKMFQQCLELPSQSRHSVCFPLLCTHFMSCTHELCPEEVNAIVAAVGGVFTAIKITAASN